MNLRKILSFGGASALMLASAMGAQAAHAQPAAPAAASAPEEATLGEVVVTARRRAESLQEVPQTVNAVTADTLQKLNIKQFQDVQSVVPGLALTPSATGFQNTASLRGISFDVTSGAQPTVAFYLNDAPLQLPFIFQSLFDIGQVEVLKGPQGTTRGVSAPSGAITITTRKPDLGEFGGYADVTFTDLQGRNAQMALNLPIIKDVLGLRVAGVIDQNRGAGVTDIHNPLQPDQKTSAFRATVSFEPNDAFNATVMYQHLDFSAVNFSGVSGPGSGAFTLGDTTFPASVNPPLRPQDRAAVSDAATTVSNHYDAVTAQFDSRIFGQHLSYVGSYSIQHDKNFAEGANPSAGDVGNVLPGIVIAQDVTTRSVQTTHEIRLASDPAPGRWFDYTVGAYYSWFDHQGHIINPGTLLPGAFGPTPTPSLAAFNPAYQIPVFIDIPGTAQETSLFGSLTLHLPWSTELTGGIRHIWSVANDQTAISTGNGLIDLAAVGLPAGFPCSALAGAFPFPVTSAGGSNCALQSAGPQVSFANRVSDTPNIYNVSLSHHFTRDFLVYVNTGTAYRPSFVSVGLQGQIIAAPGLSNLGAHPAERSRMYEIGFKSTWFDGRARLNAAIYRQRFDNLPIFVPNVYYNNVAPGETAAAAPGGAGVYAPTNFNMTQSVDALVQGFDIDAALQITHDWNMSAQFSYADGKVKGSSVPCNTFGADGRPVFNTEGLISLCPGGSTSRQPLWSLTAQTEYVHPVADDVDGFIRGLLNYYPENKRVEPDFKVPSYALVNVYAGVRSHDGAWEVSLFARNVFNTFRATDISPLDAGAPLSNPLADFPGLIHPTGYYETLTTAPREVGVNLHYAWGSR